jgi:hypothetical protein
MTTFTIAWRGLLVIAIGGPGLCLADGIVVNKLYHPYVDALEQELEYRVAVQDGQPGLVNLAQVHQLSLGTAIGQKLFAEIYLVGSKNRASGFQTQAWEAELKWQLTEQGEYGIDWGLLLEYEEQSHRAAHEFKVGLLAEKELARWSATANFFIIDERGNDVPNEFETVLSLQARYRYSSQFEPGIEFYAGQFTRGIGPVIQGTLVTGQRKSVHWEVGTLWGVSAESASNTWRFLLEYEF